MSQNQNQLTESKDIPVKESTEDTLIDPEEFQRERVEYSPLGEFQKETPLTFEDFI